MSSATGGGTVPLGERQLDALREIGNIGAGTAATALAQMTGTAVPMDVPRVSVLPVERIADEIGGGDIPAAAVFLGVHGDAPGHMLFLMRAESARKIVDALLCGLAEPGGEDEAFDEMELSALQEMGNILTGSYLGAMAQLTGLRLEPAPPAVGVDVADALLGSALAEVATVSETALLIETAFGGAGVDTVGQFLYIPTQEALATVLERLGLGG
jgi:chemotaxis protein CheC